MAKQIKLSYRFGATKAERDAWDALAEIAKEQGLSDYYFKQIFGKTSKRSKAAASIRKGWQNVIQTYPNARIDANRPYVYKGAPYAIGIKKAQQRQSKHDTEYYNDFLEFWGIAPLELDGTPLTWNKEEIQMFTNSLQSLWRLRRGRIKNGNMFDFFENISADSKAGIHNDRLFFQHWQPFIDVMREIVEEMRQRHAMQKKTKEEHTAKK